MRRYAAILALLSGLLPGQVPIRINSGGAAQVVGGELWEADRYLTTEGAPYALPAGAGLPAHLMDLRYGNFVYEIPAALGDYNLRLWFADPLTTGTGGTRKFSVSVNGEPWLTDFDVIAEAGGPLRSISREKRIRANGSIRLQFITGLRNAIVNAIEVLPVPPVPSVNCPEPVLSLRDARTLVIGVNWTPATPCFVHQNVTLAIDPLLIQALTAPVEVKLKPGQTLTDDLYVTLTSPRAGVPARLKISATGATSGALLESSASYDIIAHTTPRVFLPGSSPVGMAFVRSGEFSPLLHGFLGKMPLYIDGTVPLSVLSHDGGFRFVLNPGAAAVAQMQLRREQDYALIQSRTTGLLAAMAEAQREILGTAAGQEAKRYRETLEALRSETAELRARFEMVNEQREMTMRYQVEQALAEGTGQARMRMEQQMMEIEGSVLMRLQGLVEEARAVAAALEKERKAAEPVTLRAGGGAPE